MNYIYLLCTQDGYLYLVMFHHILLSPCEIKCIYIIAWTLTSYVVHCYLVAHIKSASSQSYAYNKAQAVYTLYI
jgi:hypothetical protein